MKERAEKHENNRSGESIWRAEPRKGPGEALATASLTRPLTGLGSPVFLRKMSCSLARAKNVFYVYGVKRLLPNSRDTSI